MLKKQNRVQLVLSALLLGNWVGAVSGVLNSWTKREKPSSWRSIKRRFPVKKSNKQSKGSLTGKNITFWYVWAHNCFLIVNKSLLVCSTKFHWPFPGIFFDYIILREKMSNYAAPWWNITSIFIQMALYPISHLEGSDLNCWSFNWRYAVSSIARSAIFHRNRAISFH